MLLNSEPSLQLHAGVLNILGLYVGAELLDGVTLCYSLKNMPISVPKQLDHYTFPQVMHVGSNFFRFLLALADYRQSSECYVVSCAFIFIFLMANNIKYCSCIHWILHTSVEEIPVHILCLSISISFSLNFRNITHLFTINNSLHSCFPCLFMTWCLSYKKYLIRISINLTLIHFTVIGAISTQESET